MQQIFTLPNNEEGRLILQLMRKYLTGTYLLKVKGRTPNHEKRKRLKAQKPYAHVPLKYAENMGVYLIHKDSGGVVGEAALKQWKDMFFQYIDMKRGIKDRLTKLAQEI